jgi:hypothetical protein
LVAILGGIVILSSCNGDETAQGFGDPSREVTFSAYAKKASRTRVAETTSNDILDFSVFGIWSEDLAAPNTLSNLTPAAVSRTNASSPWEYTPRQPWPATGTIDFYAFSPTGATGLTPGYDGQETTIDPSDMTIDYIVPGLAAGQDDLLVAVKTGVSCVTPAPVSLHFQHALSRIQLKARRAFPGTSYNIHSVAFLNLSDEGTLELNTTNIPDAAGFTYNDNVSDITRTPLVLWTGHNAAATDYSFDLDGAANNTPVSIPDQSTYTNIITGSDALLVLPQPTALGLSVPVASAGTETDPSDGRFYVKIAFATTAKPAAIKVKYFAVKEPLDPTLNLPLTFEAGRSYTFVVDLSDDDCIDFAGVTVEEMDEAFGNDVSSTNISFDPNPGLTEAYMPAAHQGFAGSHIYWDAVNNRLTFDDVDVTDHEQYQGLFFKWGSLVGISPVGDNWDDDVNVYLPTGADGNYVQTTVADAVTDGAFATSAYADIPSGSTRNFTNEPIDGDIDFDLRKSGFVTFLNSDPANLAAFKGDICAYLSGREGIPAGYWRLPASAEFAPGYPGPFVIGDNYTIENSDSFVAKESNKADGTYVINNGYFLTSSAANAQPVFFPASGYRSYLAGALLSTGLNGQGWSSSPVADQSYYFVFNASTVGPANNNCRTCGMPVRCVKK